MRWFVLCIALLMGAPVQAADDLEFTTPVATETLPACDVGACSTVQFTHASVAYHRGRRPVARWFQEHRPVRRVLRAAVRFVGHRCCR